MFYAAADCINRLNCHDISFMNIKLPQQLIKLESIHAASTNGS